VSVYEGHGVTLHHGDCLDVLRTLPDASVDSVVTDPPYGLEFMGKEWDRFGAVTETATEDTDASHPFRNGTQRVRFGEGRAATAAFGAWCEPWAAECLRVLRPGGHLLAFGGTRTWHRLACAVEDAGFEVRDSIAWLYGSGFPKSLDVSKAIDKAAGAERESSGDRGNTACAYLDRGDACPGHGDAGQSMSGATVHRLPTAPATDAAREWAGWGTALKPAFEPVVVARKPLAGTVAANVLEHGTGALNVDGCRIGNGDDRTNGGATGKRVDPDEGYMGSWSAASDGLARPTGGRWPANVVLDESQAAALDEQSGESVTPRTVTRGASLSGKDGATARSGGAMERREDVMCHGDSGGASRFFYVAKADASERPRVNGTAHPTVKPLDLMRWLVRLVTPPGGTVLEPFAGSGTTVEACIVEGFQCIAIEKGEEYLPLITQRIHRQRNPVEAIRQTGDDLGLFELDGEGA
jgi:site-specific DNA-methyltransferase (adenine-specific)